MKAKLRESEWLRALLVYTGTPLFAMYLAFAALNQVKQRVESER